MTGSGWLVPSLSLDSLPESCIAYSDGVRPYIAVKVAQTPPSITSVHIDSEIAKRSEHSARRGLNPSPSRVSLYTGQAKGSRAGGARKEVQRVRQEHC